MFSQGKPYVLPRETQQKKRENENGSQKSQQLENRKNTKSKIQCFLKEKQMFYLERQNPKYGKMIKKD